MDDIRVDSVLIKGMSHKLWYVCKGHAFDDSLKYMGMDGTWQRTSPAYSNTEEEADHRITRYKLARLESRFERSLDIQEKLVETMTKQAVNVAALLLRVEQLENRWESRHRYI